MRLLPTDQLKTEEHYFKHFLEEYISFYETNVFNIEINLNCPLQEWFNFPGIGGRLA